MKLWWFFFLFLVLLFSLSKSPSIKANEISFYQHTAVWCLFSIMESIGISKCHLFFRSQIFTTLTSTWFPLHKKFVSHHPETCKDCIVSLICGFNPYIFTFKGNTCPTNHCYFHFNRQCIQILIRIRCCELPVHIKQKNNEHPDYIRRTVTKDI